MSIGIKCKFNCWHRSFLLFDVNIYRSKKHVEKYELRDKVKENTNEIDYI